MNNVLRKLALVTVVGALVSAAAIAPAQGGWYAAKQRQIATAERRLQDAKWHHDWHRAKAIAAHITTLKWELHHHHGY